MGSQQQFCLRWNNHQINMLGVFDHLLQSETLVDVTLACEGLSLKAHKVVLSACSPFFQHIFLENPCKHPVIILKDVKFSDLRALVDFMYRGEVNVSQDQLSALLKTAEALKVKGLAEVTGGAAGTEGGAVSDSALTTTTVPASLLSASQADDSPPPQPPPPPVRMADTGQLSPPAKRKKTRQRRRSGSSTGGFSDPEESPEMQTPLEVVETKVEVMDDDYQSVSGGAGPQGAAAARDASEMVVLASPQSSAVPTAEMQLDQSPQHSTEASLPINTMTVFGSGSALDGSVSTSSSNLAALSHQSSHLSLPSQPITVPHLPQSSGVIASTSGAPSTGQGGRKTPLSTSPQTTKDQPPAKKTTTQATGLSSTVTKQSVSVVQPAKTIPQSQSQQVTTTPKILQAAKPQLSTLSQAQATYPRQPTLAQALKAQPAVTLPQAVKPQPSTSQPAGGQGALLWDRNRSQAAALHLARTRAVAFHMNTRRAAVAVVEMARARESRTRPGMGLGPGPAQHAVPLRPRAPGMQMHPASSGMAMLPRSNAMQMSPRGPGMNLPPRTLAAPMPAPHRAPSVEMAAGSRLWQSQPPVRPWGQQDRNINITMAEILRSPTMRPSTLQGARAPIPPQATWAAGPPRAPFMPNINRAQAPQRPGWSSQVNWGASTSRGNMGGNMPQNNPWGGRN